MNAKDLVLEAALAEIERQLPPVVFRNWYRWRDVIPRNHRSVANDDAKGIGPSEKVYIGGHCGYPKASFMEYLRRNSKSGFRG